jgi:predicted dehydrogenase
MPKTYRIGVIGRTGHGDYGHGIDTVWLEIPNAQIVGVADDNKAGLANAAKRLKVEATFADYREMLEKTKPDIVSICPRWIDKHHELVLAVAERGIHIYMEKPFCRTLEEADAMVAACERSHVKLAIAHQSRYSPKAKVVKQLIESGKIGRVLEYRGRGKEDNTRGGAEDAWVLGTHIFDLIRLFGGHPQWCQAVVTQGGRSIAKKDVIEGNEGLGPLAGDSVKAIYGMPDGSTAYFASTRNMAGSPSRFGLQIYGSRGVIEVLTGHLSAYKILLDPSWSPGRSGASWQNITSAGIGNDEPLKDGGLHGGNLLAVKDLIAAIEEDRQPLGSVYEARGATEMILAAFEAQRLGRQVKLPLENRKHPLTMLT